MAFYLCLNLIWKNVFKKLLMECFFIDTKITSKENLIEKKSNKYFHQKNFLAKKIEKYLSKKIFFNDKNLKKKQNN